MLPTRRPGSQVQVALGLGGLGCIEGEGDAALDCLNADLTAVGEASDSSVTTAHNDVAGGLAGLDDRLAIVGPGAAFTLEGSDFDASQGGGHRLKESLLGRLDALLAGRVVSDLGVIAGGHDGLLRVEGAAFLAAVDDGKQFLADLALGLHNAGFGGLGCGLLVLLGHFLCGFLIGDGIGLAAGHGSGGAHNSDTVAGNRSLASQESRKAAAVAAASGILETVTMAPAPMSCS